MAEALVLALLLITAAALTGCDSGSVGDLEKHERIVSLIDDRNIVDIDSAQASYPSVVTGTVTRTETTATCTYMLVRVNSFRVVGASGDEDKHTPVPPGTEVVIDWHRPEQDPVEGQSVQALVRIVKSPDGFGLIAESVQAMKD